MANNYYNSTGVLSLNVITPVITALFEHYHLDGDYPGEGKAYIADIAEETDDSVDSLLERLQELAETLGVTLDESTETQVVPVAEADIPYGNESNICKEYLRKFGAYFNIPESDVGFYNSIEFSDFSDGIGIEQLFELALRFNDGHGLTSLSSEGSWYCSKPRLGEFGGNGLFLGVKCSLSRSSSELEGMAYALEGALLTANYDKAAGILCNEALHLLKAVKNPTERAVIQAKLSNLLGQPSGPALLSNN
jgi:hypothetical protein